MSQHDPVVPEYFFLNSTLLVFPLNWNHSSAAIKSFPRFPIDYFIQFNVK